MTIPINEIENAVFIVKPSDIPYISVPFALCRDLSISNEARGFLLWLLYVTEKESLDTILPEHQSAFEELIAAGYVVKTGKDSWTVYEERQK